MQLTFRAKLLGIVGVAAFAFLSLMVASAAIATKVAQQLASVEHRYLPRIELELQLQGQLERIERGFQDAVAARDLDMLAAAISLKNGFLEQVAAAGEAVDPGDAARLRAAVEDYVSSAADVSRRLIAGETGEALTDAIAEMQQKQAHTGETIQTTTALTRDDVRGAFVAATQAELAARSYRLWISVGCLGAVLGLSLVLSRDLLRSVRALSEGFARFGRGEFDRPIPVMSSDELAQLARQANDMAARLERARREQREADDRLRRLMEELASSNRELEAFSYSVAHDLRAPLRGINGFSRALLEDYEGKLGEEADDYLHRIGAATERMGELIDALLALSRVARAELRTETVDLGGMADAVMKQLRSGQPGREVELVRPDGLVAQGDAPLLRAVLENLLGNAWKFTSARPDARIELGTETTDDGRAYYVRDNGAGFDMAYAKKLFAPFQRLHTEAEFAGTGIGLATVQRIIHRHGGRIWADGAVGRGATFHFTLASTTPGGHP